MRIVNHRIVRPPAAAAVSMVDPATPGGQQPLGQSGWNLVMSEEFGGAVTVLNPTTGMVQLRTDGPTWHGWYIVDAVLPTTNPHTNNVYEEQWYALENIGISGGNLVLTAIADGLHTADGLPFTSGMITSNPSLNFLYGYAEARLKCSGVDGTWPAWWMIPQDYSWPPEIDLMEQYGSGHYSMITTWQNAGGIGSQRSPAADPLDGDYHTYGVAWSATQMRFYVDGVLELTENNTANIPQKPMYVVLNLAVDGRQTIDTGDYPTSFLVDYVRVWQ